MAYEQPAIVITLEASADLSLKQYTFVKVTGGQTVGAVAAGSDIAIGVLQNKPAAAGRAATINTNGVSKCIAGAAITAGASVSFNASGQVIAATTGLRIVGIALQAAGAANDTIAVNLNFAGTA